MSNVSRQRAVMKSVAAGVGDELRHLTRTPKPPGHYRRRMEGRAVGPYIHC
jgi:hypothetical protein